MRCSNLDQRFKGKKSNAFYTTNCSINDAMLSGNLSNAVIETMSPSTNDGTIRFVERRKQVKNDTKKRLPLTFNIGVTSWYSKYFLRSSLSYHCVSICPVSLYPITVAYHRRTSSLRIVVYCVHAYHFLDVTTKNRQ